MNDRVLTKSGKMFAAIRPEGHVECGYLDERRSGDRTLVVQHADLEGLIMALTVVKAKLDRPGPSKPGVTVTNTGGQ